MDRTKRMENRNSRVSVAGMTFRKIKKTRRFHLPNRMTLGKVVSMDGIYAQLLIEN